MQRNYNYLKIRGICVACGKNPADEGYTTCLVCRMDIRERGETHKTESKYRHQQWLKRRRDIQYAFGMCPLADWTTEDVGAYIVTHDIPVLKWYETFGFDSRTTARLTGDAVRQSALFWIKTTNPQGYAKLLERFPEFNQLT